METGSRKEMVRSVGFRFGSLRRGADCQSMNSVESCSAQNSRSSSSVRNSGTGLFFALGIGIPFFAVHVSNGDDTQERTADRERNEEVSPDAGLPDCVVPFLPLRVTNVAANDQGFMEEHIFGFFRSDPMPSPVLVRVAFLPFKPVTAIQRVFTFRQHPSIYLAYTARKRAKRALVGAQPLSFTRLDNRHRTPLLSVQSRMRSAPIAGHVPRPHGLACLSYFAVIRASAAACL